MPFLKDHPADFAYVRKLRAEGCLVDIDTERLRRFILGRTLLIACGDRDKRFWETVATIRKITGIPLPEWGTQMCVFNGAPLFLTKEDNPKKAFIKSQFDEGKVLKKLDQSLLVGHGPCGAAQEVLHLTIHQNFSRTMEARGVAKELFDLENDAVMSAFHADYAEDWKRLYAFKRKPWERVNGHSRISSEKEVRDLV